MSLASVITLEADDELSQRIRLFLSGRSQPVIRNLEVTARAGTVLLRGSVRSFYHRQLAVEFTRRVAGVLRILDELTVHDSSLSQKTASSAAPLVINLQGLSPLPASAALL